MKCYSPTILNQFLAYVKDNTIIQRFKDLEDKYNSTKESTLKTYDTMRNKLCDEQNKYDEIIEKNIKQNYNDIDVLYYNLDKIK